MKFNQVIKVGALGLATLSFLGCKDESQNKQWSMEDKIKNENRIAESNKKRQEVIDLYYRNPKFISGTVLEENRTDGQYKFSLDGTEKDYIIIGDNNLDLLVAIGDQVKIKLTYDQATNDTSTIFYSVSVENLTNLTRQNKRVKNTISPLEMQVEKP